MAQCPECHAEADPRAVGGWRFECGSFTDSHGFHQTQACAAESAKVIREQRDDLLAACKAMLDDYASYPDGNGAKLARAAIAKAERKGK